MALSTDDLSTPLGQKSTRKRRFRLPFTATQALAVILGLFLVGFVGFAIFNDDPMGGEPSVRVAIAPGKPAGEKAAAAPPAKAEAKHDSEPAKAAATAGQKTVTIIDGSSGARHDVVLPADGSGKSEPDGPLAAPTGIVPRLLEKTRYGMVPVAADGLKPLTAYAAGSDADRAKGAQVPSIAIVIGGLGVGAAKTTDAIMKLPAAVTLGFTPYGSDPGKLVERARAQHHEVLLQVPMEPFDYPDNDPGPQTLLATASTEQNLDRLMWHMSRFQGYVGIANFMGARFVATDTAMQPVIGDAAKRGLGYFDDGSTPRSTAGVVAEALAMPFARADLTIDAVPSSAEIDRALAKLETLAKERGTAIGAASALPISIERIGAWAKALESRGVLLVPLTTAMLKSKSS
ncbi:divergent polysaccharide deacetylase family protein [Rhodopseudomonas sp. P2A-2r]|uniref:divergent polysaccharide deacetylase family protein n=1 Tax=unclassified Rhodopseudomonas TaxID=2638247 RepID=UPI0022344EBD|nr:divergent polysaccharide deacetylase family protein [Rhodopseudomonas sp. P2A-2r]UZE49711.1 divergent polysaccharide deacetylase family protein [Rhodopseudomonas sp. P2A-2r]